MELLFATVNVYVSFCDVLVCLCLIFELIFHFWVSVNVVSSSTFSLLLSIDVQPWECGNVTLSDAVYISTWLFGALPSLIFLFCSLFYHKFLTFPLFPFYNPSFSLLFYSPFLGSLLSGSCPSCCHWFEALSLLLMPWPYRRLKSGRCFLIDKRRLWNWMLVNLAACSISIKNYNTSDASLPRALLLTSSLSFKNNISLVDCRDLVGFWWI